MSAKAPQGSRSPRIGDYGEQDNSNLPKSHFARNSPQAKGEAIIKTSFDYAIYNMNE